MLRMFLSLAAMAAMLAAHPYAQAARTKAAEPPAARPTTLINLNTATMAELQQLPGIGARVANRIVEYREKKGAFKKIEELMNVQGIGEKSFLKLRAQISVGAKQEAAVPPHD
jgi:comEA protein